MKTDLITSIGVAIAGFLIAFFVTNLLVPDLGEFQVKTLDDSANTSANGYNYADLDQPDPEVFNYEALNPTVEVYVGNCAETDENGECVEDSDDEDDEENTDEENQEQSNPEADDQETE